MSDAERFERKLKRRRRWVWRLVIFVLVLVTLISVGRVLLTKSVVVPDISLFPTIDVQSKLMVLNVGTPGVGDLALLETPDGFVVRRIVAGAGSTVQQTEAGILVDGALLPRETLGEQTFESAVANQTGSWELTCDVAIERLGEVSVHLCLSNGSERDADPVIVNEDEVYVRCDNRAFCSSRSPSEGVVSRQDIRGRAIFLMETHDDSEQPFYKQWFGLFEWLY